MGVISAVPESGGADLSEPKDLNRSTLCRQSCVEILRPGQAGTQNDMVEAVCLPARPRSVESRAGAVARGSVSCPPLIEPDVRVSRIRLSDWFHARARAGAPTCSGRRRWTP